MSEDIKKTENEAEEVVDTKVWRGLDSSENAVAVTTTKGAQLTWYNDLAVVRSKFHVNDTESGELMVVGPSRMNYEKVVNLIDYAARLIEKMYNSGGESGNE